MMPGRNLSSHRPNLLVVHLESVAWQTFHAFPESFPNLSALMANSRTYRMHIAPATSTQMVLSAFLHANDCEMDSCADLGPPAAHNPSFFNVLAEHGYGTAFLCATAYPDRPILRLLEKSLPPLAKTRDFADLLSAFEARSASGPFAIYVWSQVPHVNANLALAGHAIGLHDLFAGSAATADNLLGALVEILRRRGILDDTTIVAYGDHGDELWTHGFKFGLMHGIEPYMPLVHTPLVIRSAAVAPGADNRLVSTIDLGPTVMALLGVPYEASFPLSGRSLLGEPRDVVFSQNYTASQPDDPARDVRKTFAAIDRFHALHVSSRGLALYNHRLDPGNQTNLLHLCTLEPDGRVTAVELSQPRHDHLETVRHLWHRGGQLQDALCPLRDALRDRVAAKNDHAARGNDGAGHLLDLAAFDRIDPTGRAAFLNETTRPPPGEPLHHRAWRAVRPFVPTPVRRVLRRLRQQGTAA